MFTLELIPNTACNLGCYFCFASKYNDKTFKNGTITKAMEMLHTVTDEQHIFIKIYGGEVFVYGDKVVEYLKEIEDYIKNTKDKREYYSVAVITNGTIIPDSFIDYYNKKDRPFKMNVSFSLEGGKEIHNRIRHFKENGKGSFDCVISNIRRFINLTGQSKGYVQSVLSPDILDNIDKYIELMEEYKNELVFNVVPMFDDTFEKVPGKTIYKMTKLFEYYDRKIQEDDFQHIGFFQISRSIIKYLTLNQSNCEQSHCTAGYQQFSIMSNGDIYPCCKHYYNECGHITKYKNINEDTVENCSESFMGKKVMYKNLCSTDKNCIDCMKKNNFGCLGICYVEGLKQGNIEKSKYYAVCEYNKIYGQESLKLVKKHIKNEKLFRSLEMNKFFKEYPMLLNLLKEFKENQ